MKRTSFAILIVLSVLFSFTASALDLIVPFDRGFRDYEGYLGAYDGYQTGVFVLGYGGESALWNPSVEFAFVRSDSGDMQEAVGLSNISTIYLGRYEFDVVPSVATDLKGESAAGLVTELSYGMDGWTPFISADYAWLLSDPDADPGYGGAVGVSIETSVGEFLLSSMFWQPGDGRTYAGGYNTMVVDTFELLTEVSYEEGGGWGANIGFIWTP